MGTCYKHYLQEYKRAIYITLLTIRKLNSYLAEIASLIQTIYADNANGKLSEKHYATLSMSYEEEQQKLKADIPEMQSALETETDKSESLQKFIDRVQKITERKALTPELIHEFIDKIIVYVPRYLDGKRFS